MVKNFFVFAFALVLVGATGWLLFERQQSNAEKTAATLGIAVSSVTPTPTVATGDIAMQDVKNIVGTPVTAADWCKNPGQVQTLAGGLKSMDCHIGSGEEAKPGMTMTVHYTGSLEDGTVFDSSLNRGQPFRFVLGAGSVIQGWDIGVEGMRAGGKRRLAIPPELGYGAQGSGSVIPPNAALYFDIELLAAQTDTE